MVAALHNVPVLEDQDQVCIANGAEPVGNDEGGAIFRQPVHGRLDQRLGPGVYGGGGFVQNQKGRIFNHGPGDGHQLLLTGGEVGPVVELGVIALGELADEVIQAHGFAGGPNVGVADALFRVYDILPDGALK